MEPEAEAELRSLVKVTLLASASISYSRFASARIPPGYLRLLALSPVLFLLPSLPWHFASLHLRGTSAFFLVWLAPFKLVLLSFGAGPLAALVPLLPFLASATLPVKFRSPAATSSSCSSSPPHRRRCLPLLSVAKAVLLASLLPAYRFKDSVHPFLMLVAYCLHIYLSLDLVLSGARAAAALLLPGLELEPQVRSPFLAASLGDFWGRRWNLMVSAVLRPSVYLPVRARFGAAAGVLAAFLVSGFMHEVMFYYITRAPPTGEATAFFALHGACVVAETMAHRAGWGRLPWVLAAPLTVGFVATTALWLFFPPLLRHNTDVESLAECAAAMRYLNRTVVSLLARFGLA